MVDSYTLCSRCILDLTVPDINFDEGGVCNYCKIHDEFEGKYPPNESSKKILDQTVAEIKNRGKNNDYDCIVGVSGGIDSSYLLYLSKELGLRPLAVHFDNGWNSEISVSNLKKAIEKFDVDLYTYVVDWEEFKNLQIAFLKASTPDLEIPTDVGIKATLYRVAADEGIHYIIEGHNFRTEGKVPPLWSYGDARYIKNVYKRFGSGSGLNSFPNLTLSRRLYYGLVKKIKLVRPLYFIDYNRENAKKTIEREFGWEDYGGKHHESTYTKFTQSYILPKKFNIDKRKVHLSAMVRSGEITREQALEEMKKPPLSEEQTKEVREYVIKKLEFSNEEFEIIMNEKPKTFLDYPTYYPMIKLLRTPLRLVYRMMSDSDPQIFSVMDSNHD